MQDGSECVEIMTNLCGWADTGQYTCRVYLISSLGQSLFLYKSVQWQHHFHPVLIMTPCLEFGLHQGIKPHDLLMSVFIVTVTIISAFQLNTVNHNVDYAVAIGVFRCIWKKEKKNFCGRSSFVVWREGSWALYRCKINVSILINVAKCRGAKITGHQIGRSAIK